MDASRIIHPSPTDSSTSGHNPAQPEVLESLRAFALARLRIAASNLARAQFTRFNVLRDGQVQAEVMCSECRKFQAGNSFAHHARNCKVGMVLGALAEFSDVEEGFPQPVVVGFEESSRLPAPIVVTFEPSPCVPLTDESVTALVDHVLCGYGIQGGPRRAI